MRLVRELAGGVNGAGLTPGSVAGSRASGGDRIMGAEAGVHHKLAEVGWFAESDRGGFARSHTAAVTDLLRRWQWGILEHPPYSPDMCPCDYDLFTKVKEPL